MTQGDKPAPLEAKQGSLAHFDGVMRKHLGDAGLHDLIRQQTPSALPHARQTGLTIATVASARTDRALAENAEVIALTPDNWTGSLAPDAHFLLVEGSFRYAAADWLGPVLATFSGAGEAGQNPLLALVETCRSKGVPTVFWHREPPETAGDFLTLARACDHAFASGNARCEAFAALDPNLPVGLLRAAVEPRHYNPLSAHHPDDTQPRRSFFAGFGAFRALSDAQPDSIVHRLLAPALSYDLAVFDTRFDMRANSARLLEAYKARFLGCFPESDRAELLRRCSLNLAFSESVSPTNSDEERMLEALACKSLVVTNQDVADTALEGLIVPVADETEVERCIDAFAADPGRLRRMSHLAYREVMNKHSFVARLRQLCCHLGLDTENLVPDDTPLISVITPTRRPELIGFALENFRQQTYPALEMIVVLHGEDIDPAPVRALIGPHEPIRVLSVPKAESVSTVLNVGVAAARGAYFARMDDDDYYAPNFYADMMLSRNFVDFDICGKAQWMVYFEEADAVMMHRADVSSHSRDPWIAGGTFLVRNRDDRPRRFNDRVQGHADVDFIGRSVIDPGGILVTSDPFNFIQIRRADPNAHTWSVGTDAFRNRERLGSGVALEAAAL